MVYCHVSFRGGIWVTKNRYQFIRPFIGVIAPVLTSRGPSWRIMQQNLPIFLCNTLSCFIFDCSSWFFRLHECQEFFLFSTGFPRQTKSRWVSTENNKTMASPWSKIGLFYLNLLVWCLKKVAKMLLKRCFASHNQKFEKKSSLFPKNGTTH